jgi:hypothetical protein
MFLSTSDEAFKSLFVTLCYTYFVLHFQSLIEKFTIIKFFIRELKLVLNKYCPDRNLSASFEAYLNFLEDA